MTKQNNQVPSTHKPRKTYSPPRVRAHGSVEKITGWIGGPWGEFFGGIGDGWNPWKEPSGS